MKKFQKYFLLAPLLIIFNCAGVVNSRNQEVTISTSPPDAYVYVDGWITKTPAKLSLKSSRKAYLIKVKKDGYREKEVEINRKIRYSEVFLGNLIWMFGYPFAVYADFVDGHAFELRDTQIVLEEKK